MIGGDVLPAALFLIVAFAAFLRLFRDFVSTLWTDRYNPPPTPEGRRIFLKWFHEKYPQP
jgi:hypothetical protein